MPLSGDDASPRDRFRFDRSEECVVFSFYVRTRKNDEKKNKLNYREKKKGSHKIKTVNYAF